MSEKKTEKKSQKCTQDIRKTPPARYALPTDGRKVVSLCNERWMVMLFLSSYAHGDGTAIKVSVPTISAAMGWSKRTTQRRLKELRTLGVLSDGDIDGIFHTRVRTIDIGMVTDTNLTPMTDTNLTPVTDRHREGDRLDEKGDRLTEKGDRLTSQVTITDVYRPSTDSLSSSLTEPPADSPADVVEDVVDVVKDSMGSVLTDQVPSRQSSSTQDPIASYGKAYAGIVPAERVSPLQAAYDADELPAPSGMAGKDAGHKGIVIEAAEPKQDPLAGTARGGMVAKARHDDQRANGWDIESERCECCHIHRRAGSSVNPDLCEECAGACGSACTISETLIEPYKSGLMTAQEPVYCCGAPMKTCQKCERKSLCLDCTHECSCGAEYDIKTYTQCGVTGRLLKLRASV